MPNVIRVVMEGDDRLSATLRRADGTTEQLDRRLTDAGRQADRLGQEGQRAGHEVDQAMDRASHSVRQVGESSQESGGALANLREQGAGALDSLTEHAGGAGQALQALGPYGKAAAVIIGIGMLGAEKAIEGMKAALEAANDRAEQLSQSAAYLGLTKDQAKTFAKEASQVYADQWGETLKDSGEAVRNAALYIMPTPQVMRAAMAPSLTAVAERVQALADTMGEDSKRVAYAIHQMLVTGMAGSVDEAFDLMHTALAGGVDGMDNLIDQMTEYGSLMKSTGFTAKQLFGLLKQGAAGGAFDDKVIDAMKEFRLRVTGGGANIDKSFKDLGLNAKQMTKDISEGGPKAAAAMDKVFDAIRKASNPQLRDQAIQNLFGGPGEDLGTAIFGLDPSEAEKTFGDITGAADRAAARLSDKPLTAVDAMKRKWELFKADIGDKIAPMFQKVVGWVEKLADKLQPFIDYLLKDLKKEWNDNKESIEKFGSFIKEVIVPVLGGALVVAIGAIAFALEGTIRAMATVGDAWDNFKRMAVSTVAFLVNNVFAKLLDAAVFAFSWMPGIGPKLEKAQKDFEKFRDGVNQALASIMDKDIHVRVQVDQRGLAPVTAAGATSKSTHRLMASGGNIGGLPTYAGEDGIELIDWQAGRIHNFQETRRMAPGGAGPVHVTVAPVINRAGASNGFPQFLAKMIDDALFNGYLRWQVVDSRVRPV